MKENRKILLNDRDLDGTKMAADVANKAIYQLDKKLSREELIEYYIETLRMAYSEICLAFIEDSRKARGPELRILDKED